MIPATFSYHRPKSIAEATSLLAQHSDEARVLAGGQSLIPMMKLRLAVPEHLIDLGGIAELKGVQRNGNILREASLLIADPQVRYVGTLGGNIANGDPGNDMPAVMICLDATYRVVGHGGVQTIKARDFYEGIYATALKPDQIVTAVEIPVPPTGHGWAYEKLKRKVGDYATAAAGVILTVRGGKVASCAIALSNLADRALLAADAAAAVVGSAVDKDALAAAARAARAIMAPASDTRGPAEYRIAVGGVMVERALKRAFERAKG